MTSTLGAALLVRSGKNGRRREVGMDDWGWEHLGLRSAWRLALPPGPLFCIIEGPTAGRPWPQTGARAQLRRLAVQAGVRRRSRRQLRHAHAVEMAEKASLESSASSGTAILGLPAGIDNAEVINAVHDRRPPMMPATAGLTL